jgi:hypothetical protein
MGNRGGTIIMIGPISSVATQPVEQSAAQRTAQPTSPEAKPQPNSADTVQVSNAAKAMLQESMETPAQTAKEAGAGDHQATRLLAREAAERAAEK